jgi:rRNA pseudouridine-1189 N-methylase Emg1 (Nep1/Mra1 family)
VERSWIVWNDFKRSNNFILFLYFIRCQTIKLNHSILAYVHTYQDKSIIHEPTTAMPRSAILFDMRMLICSFKMPLKIQQVEWKVKLQSITDGIPVITITFLVISSRESSEEKPLTSTKVEGGDVKT